MAMMDNASFLVSHIRNSFITSDNTGMCEQIIEKDEFFDQQTWTLDRSLSLTDQQGLERPKSDVEVQLDTELSHSADILPDMDYNAYRRRSNTAQRLEKLKKEKHMQSKLKHISWKPPKHSGEDTGDTFTKQPIVPVSERNHRSSLSKQLESFSNVSNRFLEYARYDGRTSVGVPCKKIQIFLTMCESEEDRRWPIAVTTLSSAKVQDLIGLICWLYTVEDKKPEMPEDIGLLSLRIAEDDGEVDADFPALDNREPMSKFDFAKLALVLSEESHSHTKPTFHVTINMPDRGTSTVHVDHDTMPMSYFLDSLMKRRSLKQVKGMEYKLEKQKEPGVAVDLKKPLSAMDTYDFCLVRENSARGDQEEDSIPKDTCCPIAASLSSHHYKTFTVDLVHKLRTKTPVQLGISGEKIEIDPVISKGKFFKQKAFTYGTDTIAACNLIETRSSGKSTFRLVYQTGAEFRHHDFECDTALAKQIVQKVVYILDMRSNHVVKEYAAYRERKMQKRHTLSLMPT